MASSRYLAEIQGYEKKKNFQKKLYLEKGWLKAWMTERFPIMDSYCSLI